MEVLTPKENTCIFFFFYRSIGDSSLLIPSPKEGLEVNEPLINTDRQSIPNLFLSNNWATGSSFHPETGGPAGNDEGRGRPGPFGDRAPRVRRDSEGKEPRAEQPGRVPPPEPAAPMPAGYRVMGDDGSMDYSVHEAWNEATNVYLVVILVSFVLFMYAKRNKRKIMRIFSVPPTAETLSEPSFYDTMSKIRLRQQLEMYSISRKYDYQQPQNQADSVQLSLE